MIKSGNFIVSNPKLIIAAILAVTIGYSVVILTRGVSFNGSPETLARNDDTLQFFNEIRSTFGDDRVIIVALTTSDVFTDEFINKLDHLTSRLASLNGVDSTLSLSNIKAIRRDDASVSIDRLISPNRSSTAPADGRNIYSLSYLKETVTRDPLYVRHYVSADGRTAAINVFLKPLSEAETRTVAEEVERVAKSEAAGDEVLLAGVPIMDARGIHNMVRDMLVCSPIAVLLCFLAFLAAFRTFWGAVLPMAALIIGLVWTIGLMSLVGQPISLA